jgi:hypothetical protein
MASEALENLVGGLTKAVGVLENGGTRRAAAARKIARQFEGTHCVGRLHLRSSAWPATV